MNHPPLLSRSHYTTILSLLIAGYLQILKGRENVPRPGPDLLLPGPRPDQPRGEAGPDGVSSDGREPQDRQAVH